MRSSIISYTHFKGSKEQGFFFKTPLLSSVWACVRACQRIMCVSIPWLNYWHQYCTH